MFFRDAEKQSKQEVQRPTINIPPLTGFGLMGTLRPAA
jgi:hypothetical protein